MDSYHIEKCAICPVDEFISVRNREGNDYIAGLVKQYRERFCGFAVANPWFGRKGTEELIRALDRGLMGLKVHSILQGFMLCDAIADPLMEVAASYGVPVYVHTGTMGNALPFQLLELAQRHKKIKFVMGHMGYSDFWYDVIPVMERAKNVYAETSHAAPDTVHALIEQIGADRIIFGSDVPVSSLEVEIGKIRLLDLDKKEQEKVFSRNARRLLGGK